MSSSDTASPEIEAVYSPTHDVRIVTAASLFDGHDAAINIMRRILQSTGAEVIHLGHNQSVKDIVTAAIQEDAQGIAISSYQGGHMEFFKYMHDLLKEHDCGHVRIYGGGGGTIVPEEKRELEAYGIEQIFHPEDGRRMGLQGMINQIVRDCDQGTRLQDVNGQTLGKVDRDDWKKLAKLITLAEQATSTEAYKKQWQGVLSALQPSIQSSQTPVLGMTGTGGAGKSSLTDELVRRYTEDFPGHRVAVLSVDPSKRRTGGALLGDRIRMNSLSCGRVFMRSLATRHSGSEVSAALKDAIDICKAAGFDLIIAETSGIGQADASIVDFVDHSVYVMTPEFGAQSQLEKIEMIDLANMVVVNKFDKPGSQDALRDVQKAYQRAHQRFTEAVDTMPVYAAMASQFNDRGANLIYSQLLKVLSADGRHPATGLFTEHLEKGLPDLNYIIPPRRTRYLSEISDTVRGYKAEAAAQAEIAAELWALKKTINVLGTQTPLDLDLFENSTIEGASESVATLMTAFNSHRPRLSADSAKHLIEWPELEKRYRQPINSYKVRGRTLEVPNYTTSLSHNQIPRVSLPHFRDWGSLLQWRYLENLPGFFPYTAGVFPFKRTGEDPTRMFAGEGGPWRTNKRFHYLSAHSQAKRLSTAFDSVTLYGEDPDRRPDIWGKVGNSGVSVATVEDMEALFAGFDLIDSGTSVSMTINGPAPTILAFYFNAAARQSLRRYLKAEGKIDISDEDCLQPDGGGYSFAQLRALVTEDEYATIVSNTVKKVRGTVQADILKEDQAQNTCIFSTDFALKMMGDVQSWFIDSAVRNFYSVSISGYHIAEAGANPISQTAFTLANGFTFVEYYRARGMDVNHFAPNLSFFFSNGMDPEYSVIGRVARRIWSTAMRGMYGADERSQKLKYHIQTSGRSLHAQEIDFNDIRTTLQALLAIYDNCNSLHTNAYDEAITTPTEESVRRALAIQLIINNEFGVAKNENPNQGAYIFDELTELVEEAILAEFDRITDRGGVLGAMERMYQRSKIQEESLYYEHQKHTGELPLIGVNTFTSKKDYMGDTTIELIRSTEDEKEDQLQRLKAFHLKNSDRHEEAVTRLKAVVIAGDNVFGELMRAVETLSLGQVTKTLYEVGGQYRRNM